MVLSFRWLQDTSLAAISLQPSEGGAPPVMLVGFKKPLTTNIPWRVIIANYLQCFIGIPIVTAVTGAGFRNHPQYLP